MKLGLLGIGATVSARPIPLLFPANSPPSLSCNSQPSPHSSAASSDSCPQSPLEPVSPAGRVGGVIIYGKYHREKPRSTCRNSQVSVLPET